MCALFFFIYICVHNSIDSFQIIYFVYLKYIKFLTKFLKINITIFIVAKVKILIKNIKQKEANGLTIYKKSKKIFV